MAATTTAIVTSGVADPINEPINKSSDYLAMQAYWAMIDVILGGAEAIRAEGEKYLPRFQNEGITENASGRRYDPYEERRKSAPFTNIYEDISRNLSSKPFAKELNLDTGTPAVYQKLAEDIDGEGNNLHVFAQDVFAFGIDYAITWILIEFTKATPREDGQPLSKAEEQAQGLRPYWVHIHATRLLAVYSDFIEGEEIIVHARIDEPTMKLDGYIERVVKRVRVINRPPIAFDAAGKPTAYGPAVWALFEEVIDPVANTAAWVMIDQGAYTIGIIPLVPFMTGRRHPSTWRFDPPLRGLAYMQIQEYQQESNLKTVMELTCFPMLSGDGVTPPDDANGGKIPVGPRAVLYGGSSVDGRPGSWKFIEPSAASIKTLQDKLEKTQNDMRDLGYQPLTMQNLTVITTGQVAVKANSAVQAWAIKFKDALEQAWKITAMWINRPDEPEVMVFQDFNVGLDNGQAWTAVMDMRKNNDLSHEGVIDSAIRFGYLKDGFDVEKNDQELADESANNALKPENLIDPLTGKPLKQTPPNQPRPAPAIARTNGQRAAAALGQ